MDDAAVGTVEAEQGDAEVAAVLLQLGDLGRGHGVHDGQVLVDWSASVAIGDVEYVVVRREGRAPTSIEDGTVVFRGEIPCRRAGGVQNVQARPNAARLRYR